MINKKYMRILFVLYLLILLKVIVFKYPLGQLVEIAASWQRDVFWEGIDSANFEFFRTIKLYTRYWEYKELNSFGNLIGNVLIFIPLGYMLPRVFKWSEKFIICMLQILLLVLGIELFQLFTNFGVFDVDDILLNFVGGVIGYLFYRKIQSYWAKKSLNK